MKVLDTEIQDVKIIVSDVFVDERGFFFESYNARVFEETLGRKVQFVQDNHSKSAKGVLRGMHYQMMPNCQAKLVRCIAGEIFDVAVDIRTESPTFGKWVAVTLSAQSKYQLWIPEGFAHGFLALTEEVEVVYKTNAYYSKGSESGFLWSDPTVGIEWPISASPILSEKDKGLPAFERSNFNL
ncbi:dTDP-4-dehydrorhamnose 3,5-epimerase [Chitiniphilus shinanonensis]|uniref:dTDP-4-dehydrorhamnose 3,5-epimerase n=1 Tax=Chitiniphilus shinanonensis TaxID=553088 RepID=UPI0030665016